MKRSYAILAVALSLGAWGHAPRAFAEWSGGSDQLTYGEFSAFVEAKKNLKIDGRPVFSQGDMESIRELDPAVQASDRSPVRDSLVRAARIRAAVPDVPNDLVVYHEGKKEKAEEEDQVKKMLKAIASRKASGGLENLYYEYMRRIYYNRKTKQSELQKIYAYYRNEMTPEMMGADFPPLEVDPSIQYPVLATYNTADRKIRFGTHTASMSLGAQLPILDHEWASGHAGDNGPDGSSIGENSKGGAEEFAYGFMGCGVWGGC